jgi:23S rRNA (uracil1939-C5)-methyltransferase
MCAQKTVEVKIQKLSKKGLGLGVCEEFAKPIELRQAYPGEHLVCQVTKKKQGVHQGVALEILNAHPSRVQPRCEHASVCGGCTYQTLDYQEQLFLKEKTLISLFEPFLAHAQVYPILGMEDPWRFRNKMEWTFYQAKEGLGSVGLIEAGSKGRVFDVKECHLCPSWMSKVLDAVRTWWHNHPHVQAYHRLKKTGTLHLLTMREGVNTQQKMVVLTVCGEPTSSFSHGELESFKQAILDSAGQTVSLFLQIKHIQEGMATYCNEMVLHGKDHILEKLHVKTRKGARQEYTFKISPSSFFQPNTKQAQALFSAALSLVKAQENMRILDLYAGTGTLGIIFSSLAKEVISIELNPYATFDAQVNAELCGLTNLTILQGDVHKVIAERPIQGNIDLVILDPPRSGLGAKVVSQVLDIAPWQILYISCNPYTQAEDIKLFAEKGYQIQAMQAVDQFGHGPHLENILVLEKSS